MIIDPRQGGSETWQALRDLAVTLRSKIVNFSGSPWIPGREFADGTLIAALEQAEELLRRTEDEGA